MGAAHRLSLVLEEEDDFDKHGFRVEPGTWRKRMIEVPVYDVASSNIHLWGLAIPGQPPNKPRYDKPALAPWQLSFWDNLLFDLKESERAPCLNANRSRRQV